MIKAGIPLDEAVRLQALEEYAIPYTQPQNNFDDITKIASQICSTSISLISIVGSRQWFISNHGWEMEETSREYSFCAHAINTPGNILIVPDARLDERFADNSLVTGDPHIVFYAGVPLVNPEGYALGTLCVIDTRPGQLNKNQVDALKALADLAVKLLEFRKKHIRLNKRQVALERTVEIFAQTKKLAKVGGWQFDLLNNNLTWTSVTKEIHEVPLDFVPDLQTGINFYKKGRSRETITQLVNEAKEKGTAFDAELEIITAKGNERWVRAKGEAQFHKGKCTRIYGIFQDIHIHKLKDVQLSQSEEQFRQTFNYATIGMALVAPDGRWLKVNKSLCKIVGYSEEELLQITFQDITHPDDLSMDMKPGYELIKGKIQSYELEKRYFHKDGHIVWTILSVSLVRDQMSKPIHFVCQVIDITKRKQAEQILMEERKLLKTLIDNIPVNIFIKDLNSRKILVNQKEIEYTGAESEMDILGKDDFELFSPAAAIIPALEDEQVFKTGNPLINKETFSVKHDGSDHWFLTSKIALRNEQNEITGLLGVNYDISQRKENEKKLKALVDITGEQNMRLINFAHIVSHNLSSHSTNFSRLLEYLENETDESSKQEMFSLLKKASLNLTETVAHLNEVVALNTSIKRETQLINLNRAILNVQNNIKALLLEQQVECINEIDEAMNINAVPAYLDSILLNFFTNSIKYKSPERQSFIKLTAIKENKCTILTIEDNGLGIDLKKHGDKLFGMYKTFHGNKDARGVGLFITKNQIEAMGGKVEAESKPGEGTTFKIFFYEKN